VAKHRTGDPAMKAAAAAIKTAQAVVTGAALLPAATVRKAEQAEKAGLNRTKAKAAPGKQIYNHIN